MEKLRNYEYYEKRTLHGSSLSLCTYALMGLEVGKRRKAYNYFMKTSYIDLLNATRNTSDGIHGAATGGAWRIVVNGFAGMDVRDGILSFRPWLPKRWKELSYSIFWRGRRIEIRISHKDIRLKLTRAKKEIVVNVQGRLVTLYPERTKTIRLKEVKKEGAEQIKGVGV
jgi:kojibiose phosphorylase